ncbi:MAG: NupC/NupG family nucleoside CNT transporter [Bacteroidetes bacterium]|nr:NupC/NupG family nucleoside CNT transporter [Bacteroidota bacterium]MBU1114611.1 NupC/NupG family nucleoside CNT transporter [Bacteroidota bacterium]MBU1797819.1 NupC/NupG family nucleoside CNT transporter [Bacteroidota bacterium]
MDFVSIFRGMFGILLLVGIAFLFSNNKRKINWRLVATGLSLQFIFALLIIKGDYFSQYFSPLGWPKLFFAWVSSFFVIILNFTTEGAKFVFGNLAISPGTENSMGMFFAFQVLPTIIFFASLMAILYHLGIMQRVVQAMAWVMAKLLGTSGAESLSAAANIFVGQTEAPLMIKPYIKNMTNSEILTIMVGGMATVAGGVMAAYIQILSSTFATVMGLSIGDAQLMFATHLLGASVMAAPAGLIMSKIIYPETEVPETRGEVKVEIEKTSSNVIEAAATGASDGLQLALNVAAMLLAFIALIALSNYLLEGAGNLFGLNSFLISEYGQPLNLQFILGFVFQFLAYGIGVPWESAMQFGSLFGTKIVLNEFVAYFDMSSLIASKEMINEKTILMATYALCGFANFSSIAIQIGGLSPLAPNRKSDFAKLGLKALVGGALSTLMTATLAGILF